MATRRIDGLLLPDGERMMLIEHFPPRYARLIAHHVTFKPGTGDARMPDGSDCAVVGHADDGAGVQALVVAIGGTTDRPDGSTWHITWSLAEGRAARESNDVIAALGWQVVEPPIPIALHPGSWEWTEEPPAA